MHSIPEAKLLRYKIGSNNVNVKSSSKWVIIAVAHTAMVSETSVQHAPFYKSIVGLVWPWPWSLTSCPQNWLFYALAPWITCANWHQNVFSHYRNIVFTSLVTEEWTNGLLQNICHVLFAFLYFICFSFCFSFVFILILYFVYDVDSNNNNAFACTARSKKIRI